MKKIITSMIILPLAIFAAEVSPEELAAAKTQESASQAIVDVEGKKLAAAKATITQASIEAGNLSLSSHAELGYVKTSGNTNTATGSLNFVEKAKWGKNLVQFDFDYLYGEEDSVENNNKLQAVLNYDYSFADKFAFNYLASYQNDKFSGFDYQFNTGPGIKYKALTLASHTLSFQTNILFSRDVTMEKYFIDDGLGNLTEIKYPYANPTKDLATDIVESEIHDYTSFFIKGDYEWAITDSFKFAQILSYRVNADDVDVYYVTSKSSISSKLSDMFSMGVNYKVDYVNAPPVGNVYSDKVFTATLILDY